MRIIAGEYKSRQLKTLDSTLTRPTLDQVKESFFNRVGPYFKNESICDVFGGSGAIALEFLSRGCQRAVIIEKDRNAVNIIKENIMIAKDKEIKVYPISYTSALKQITEKFDYVYCDPPYNFQEIDKLFSLIKEIIHPESQIFYECDIKEKVQTPLGYELLKVDEYRRTKILWFVCEQFQKDGDQ